MSVKSTILAGAAAATLALGASGASAASLTINDGNFGNIPGPGSAVNDLLEPLGLETPLYGYYGGTISGTGSSYQYEFLGFEAGAENQFQVSGETVFSTEDYDSNFEVGNPLETVIRSFLDFAFLTDRATEVVTDDLNFDNVDTDLPNYFATFLSDATTGNALYLFFDDTGAGDDDNHDDLAVRITALSDVSQIPVPAPLGLLVASLAGMGLLSFRRRKAGEA